MVEITCTSETAIEAERIQQHLLRQMTNTSWKAPSIQDHANGGGTMPMSSTSPSSSSSPYQPTPSTMTTFITNNSNGVIIEDKEESTLSSKTDSASSSGSGTTGSSSSPVRYGCPPSPRSEMCLQNTLIDPSSKSGSSHHGNLNHTSNSHSKLKKNCKRIKVTILNLSGIKVQTAENQIISATPSYLSYLSTPHHQNSRNPTSSLTNATNHYVSSSKQSSKTNSNKNDNKSNNHLYESLQKYAITASVSFTGSCDPSDMRIVSSGFDCLSQRLIVESLPVVVPHGMTDSLIAIWDDHKSLVESSSNETASAAKKSCLSLRKEESVDGLLLTGGERLNKMFGQEKGKISIPGEQSTLPHLFVSIWSNDDGGGSSSSRNNSSSCCIGDNYQCDDDNTDPPPIQLCCIQDISQTEEKESPIIEQQSHQHEQNELLQKASSDMATADSRLHQDSHHSRTFSELISSVHNSMSPDLDETDTSSSHISKDLDSNSLLLTGKDVQHHLRKDRNDSNTPMLVRSSTLSPFQSLTNIREINESSNCKNNYGSPNSGILLRSSNISSPSLFNGPSLPSDNMDIHHHSVPEDSPVELPFHNDSESFKLDVIAPTLGEKIKNEVKNTKRGQQSTQQKSFRFNQTQTIVNTPSQASMETTIPEILEFNIAIRIQQIPSESGIEEMHYIDNNNVQSLCSPDVNGGGAVAHLVLFPEVLNGDAFLSNGNKGQILELPVRKKNFSLSRSNISVVSGITTNSFAYNDTARRCYSVVEPNLLVDLEDDATIRVKIEECTIDDIEALDNEQKLSLSKSYTALDLSLVDDVDEAGDKNENCNKNDISLKNSSKPCKQQQDGDKGAHPSEQSYSAPHGSQVNPEDVEKEFMEGDISRPTATDYKSQQSKSPLQHTNPKEQQDPDCNQMMLCDVFQFLNISDVFSKIMSNCNDDVNVYGNLHNTRSMDSSIRTMEYH